MAIENFPVIKKVNNPYEFAPVVPANIQKVDMSKPNVPLVQTAPINYVAPKKAVAQKASAPVSAPVKTPSMSQGDLVQAMVQKNPRLAEAYNRGEVTDSDIINASIKKYPKVKQAVLDGDVELNTAENKGVVPGPSIVEKGLGVLAGASKGALDYLNKADTAVKEVTSLGAYDESKDWRKQAYNKWSEMVFDKAKANDTGSFDAGQVGGKALASMALIPGLGPIKGAGVAKNVIVGALEGAATTQANSFIETGKAASMKDTLYGAAAGGAAMGVLRKLQKGGSLKQTEQLVLPKITPSEQEIRGGANLLKKSKFGGKITALPNKMEKEMASVGQKILNPNGSIVTNIARTNKAITKEADAYRKLVEKIPMPEKNTTIYDIKKAAEKIEQPLSMKGETTLQNQWKGVKDAYFKILNKHKDKGVVGFLDGRQEFDQLMKRDFPNLYTDDAKVPLRNMVADLRDLPNEFINKATGGVGAESLKKQSLLIRIKNNLATKTEKVGSTNLSRRGQRNKNVVRLGRYVAGGAALAGAGAIGAKLGLKSTNSGGGE